MAETAVASHVLAADYRVTDLDRWWVQMASNPQTLGRLGARHMVAYRALDDPHHIFTTIGVHHRGPLDQLLRSPVIFEWFDQAGVGDLPPLFAGDVYEKLDVVSAGDDDPAHPPVIVAGVAPVSDLDRLVARLHDSEDLLRRSGVRQLWIYRALDDGHEVMILQQIDSEEHAAAWLRHPEALDEWLAGAGVGVYPPPFVGTLLDVVQPHAVGEAGAAGGRGGPGEPGEPDAAEAPGE